MNKALLTLAVAGLVAAPCVAEQLSLTPHDRIVILGDSITEMGDSPRGFVTIIRQGVAAKHPDWGIEVFNAGISGNKVPDLQGRLDADVITRQPTLVIVYIGINDVWHSLAQDGTPADKYEAGLTDVLSRIQHAGSRALLCTPSVIGEKTGGVNRLDNMLDEYSAISRKVAAKLGVPICDLRKAFTDYEALYNAANADQGILTEDTCHLNDAGNAFVALQFWQALGEYDPKTAKLDQNAWVLPDLISRPFPMGMTAVETAFAGMQRLQQDGKPLAAIMVGYAALRDIEQARAKGAINNLEAILARQQVGDVLVQCEQTALLGKDEQAYKQYLTEVADLTPKAWRFHPDSENAGIQGKWFAPTVDRTEWKPIDVSKVWLDDGNSALVDEQGKPITFLSAGWYSLQLDVPQEWAGRDLYLWFTCDEDAAVWVNGTLVKVRDEGDISRWSVPSLAPLSAALQPCKTNTIVIRTHNTKDAGGLWRGVRILEPKA